MSRIDPWLRSSGSFAPRRVLPDVARDATAPVAARLERVGMSGIEIAFRRRLADGSIVLTPARADAFVSLDVPEAKGIHMSRLFLELEKAFDSEELSPVLLDRTLAAFLASHEELSSVASLRLEFEHLERRPALLSEHRGWRSYPVAIDALRDASGTTFRLSLRVAYSSACPCSAALSRQLLQEKFEDAFAGHAWVNVAHVGNWLRRREATVAVPHSQRSHADVTVELPSGIEVFPIARLVDSVESSLGTPVQAAVKREDEQEFARLNGSFLMFCEDAARRIRDSLERDATCVDYRIEVRHLESLHPHDAVAIVTKGVEGGLSAR